MSVDGFSGQAMFIWHMTRTLDYLTNEQVIISV